VSTRSPGVTEGGSERLAELSLHAQMAFARRGLSIKSCTRTSEPLA